MTKSSRNKSYYGFTDIELTVGAIIAIGITSAVAIGVIVLMGASC